MTLSQTKVPIAPPSLNNDDIQAVSNAVASGWISGRGRYVVTFEEEFGNWLGVKNTVSCTSGTTALHLALASIEVNKDHEVIIPAFSMGAVAFAVAYTGARIVLVDSELDTWNMDSSLVEEKITPRTKAIIAMHTYGHPVDLGPLVKLCNEKGISLIEDAAESHGAEYKGRKTGSVGDIGCFSFFANKIITTGEGGAVVTNNDQIAEKAKILRDMAFSKDLSKKFLHEHIGYNYRMTNMQAALGSSQLKRIEQFIEIRRRNASLYNELLSNLRGIVTAPESNWAKNVYWMYSILVDSDFEMSRDKLMFELSNRGIETRPFFVPIHQQPIFAIDHIGERYEKSERLSLTGLNLPSGNTLTEEQIRHVASTIKSLGR